MNVGNLPRQPPALTDEYVAYLRSRVKSGMVTVESAVQGARERNPDLSREEARMLITWELWKEEEDESEGVHRS